MLLDDRGVEPDPGHGGEQHPAGLGQVDLAVLPAEPGREGGVQPGRYPQRPGGQVGRAARHDGQRHARAGQHVGAGAHGAVAARRDDQAGPGRERVPGQSQAVVARVVSAKDGSQPAASAARQH